MVSDIWTALPGKLDGFARQADHLLTEERFEYLRLVIPSWFVDSSFHYFEAMNPLFQCVRRIRDLGSKISIEIPFLAGAARLPEGYVSDLATLGARIHDVSDLAHQFRAEMPSFAQAYEQFGTIRDFAILRQFVLRDFLDGEQFIAMDNDIIVNVPPEEIIEAYRGKTFLVNSSPCFSFISDRNWLSTFCKYARLLHDDPTAYSAEVGFVGDRADLLIPTKAKGTDQSITIALIKANLLRNEPPDPRSEDEPFILVGSWFFAGRLGKNLHYQRVDARDFIDGRTVAISHLHNNFANMLGAYLYVRELQKFNFGRIPCQGLSPEQADAFNNSSDIPYLEKLYFVNVLSKLYQLRRAAASEPLPLEHDPFSRKNLYKRFYETGDFSQVFCDENWWEAGVWNSKPGDKSSFNPSCKQTRFRGRPIE